MRKFFYLLLIALLFASCNQSPKTNQLAANAGEGFSDFKNAFIEKLWRTYPVWATSQGYHKYDSVLVVPDDSSRVRELAFAQWTEDGLKKTSYDSLSDNDKTDFRMIENFIDGVRFNNNQFRSYEWDPSQYNLGDAIFEVMDYKDMPVNEKLLCLSKRLAAAPAYFEAAKKNLKNPTLEHTRLAIKQSKGTLSFFTKTFPDSLKASTLSKEQIETFNKNAATAHAAIEDYVKFLGGLLDGDTAHMRSFRIGKELYAKKFLLDIDSRFTADSMYKMAEARKDELHRQMAELTSQLWGKYFGSQKPPADTLERIKKLIDKISVQHCKADDFMQTIERQMPELVAFINSHNIIDLDSTKPLKVRKTPEYMAGVAGASINSPGPYDTSAATYYNVTPLKGMSAEEAESYLREYNNYVLQILDIHEAIPGHYTQLIYANRSPDLIKSIFGNGAMIEGWACYVERMMI